MATAAAFKPETIQSCVITIEGVCGDLLITGIGTAWLVVTTAEGEDVVLVVHQCLQSNGEHNLLSVSQILQLPAATVVLTNNDPVVTIMDEESNVATVIPFRVIDGVFVVPCVVLSSTDPRLRKLRRGVAGAETLSKRQGKRKNWLFWGRGSPPRPPGG